MFLNRGEGIQVGVTKIIKKGGDKIPLPIRYRPSRELARMDDWFDRVFSEFSPTSWLMRELRPDVDWVPAVELIDKKDHFLLRADVPGVKKENPSISAEGDTLSIKGELKKETEEKSEHFYCCERTYGTFGRIIKLPSEVQNDKVEASLADGILEVKLPKAKRRR